MIGMPLRPIMAGIQSTPDRITIVSTNRGRKILIEKEREEVGMASRFHVKTFSSSIQHQMFQHNSRGRPLNAPAAFIHPCQPIVAKQRDGRVRLFTINGGTAILDAEVVWLGLDAKLRCENFCGMVAVSN